MPEDDQVIPQASERLPFEMPQNARELRDLLKQYGVWSEDWSDQKVMELYEEVRFGEKRLVEYYDPEDEDHTNPRLGAEMDIISVDVRTNVKGEEQVLVETWQTSIYIYESNNLDNGTQNKIDIKKRERKLPRSLSEKMKPGEEVIAAARRAMEEELAIFYETDYTLDQIEVLHEEKMSKGFPGLKTFTDVNVFRADVTESGYRHDYIEREDLPSEPGVKAFKDTLRRWQTPQR